MTTIILYGYLRDLHPHEIRVEANSAAEALHSLSMIPALCKEPGKRHSVKVDGFDSADALFDKRKVEVIHVRPVVAGAGGRSGIGQIVIGVVMVAVAILAPQFLAPLLTQGQVVMAGAMMVLGGVMQLLAPQPQIGNGNEEKSRYLGNGRNTATIGTRIPMIYGRRKAYGHYLSFDIDAGKFDSAPSSWYASPWTQVGDLNYAAAPVDLPMEEPDILYATPTSFFSSVSYPATFADGEEVFINFSPAVSLLAGAYDIQFETGHTLHVTNPTAGTVSKVTLLGGEIYQLPPAGTSITFTRNYV